MPTISSPVMAKLSRKRRKALRVSEFAIPSELKYPIDTMARARSALAYSAKYSNLDEKHHMEARMVCAAVARKWPNLHEGYCRLHFRKIATPFVIK